MQKNNGLKGTTLNREKADEISFVSFFTVPIPSVKHLFLHSANPDAFIPSLGVFAGFADDKHESPFPRGAGAICSWRMHRQMRQLLE